MYDDYFEATSLTSSRCFLSNFQAAIPDVHYPPADQDVQGGYFDGPIRRLHLNESFLPPSPKVKLERQLKPQEGSFLAICGDSSTKSNFL